MSTDIPTTQWNLTYLVNLVILGLLIDSYYYFGIEGAAITFVLVMFLVPVSGEDVLETGTRGHRTVLIPVHRFLYPLDTGQSLTIRNAINLSLHWKITQYGRRRRADAAEN